MLALLATFLIARSICGRLASSVEAAQRIANGDLTSTPPSASKDEVGLLIVAMNEMQHSLRDTLLKTRDSAASILNCSAELTSSVRQMEESADIQSSAAAAIAVTRPGAQTSLPTTDEVEALVQQRAAELAKAGERESNPDATPDAAPGTAE